MKLANEARMRSTIKISRKDPRKIEEEEERKETIENNTETINNENEI